MINDISMRIKMFRKKYGLTSKMLLIWLAFPLNQFQDGSLTQKWQLKSHFITA